MLFPTFTFILGFLPLTVIVYFLLALKNRTASRIWLILASFVFYSWFNWSYSLILGGSLLMNWIFAQLLYNKQSKFILTLGIICNVLLLGYFKYYDFFVENINVLFGTSFLLKHILLPLGISFFTFQQISFLQLVYSRSLQRYSFGSYALFVCFFPQLIAGPIVLPDEMMRQFDKDDCLRPDARNIAAGLYIFSLGMAKKILLADFFAEIADPGFLNAAGNFFTGWKTALAYTFQIYFDFSGYCDMAIGIGLLFNIRLPKNFHAPYRSENIADFWRRWHITLGRFLMTGLYIPLGG
ncbi:MAG: MBOAT family protein, partial [Lentisphaeria bacterium]|nr:MBOAT family protein [Lentisphaeria bacterium]